MARVSVGFAVIGVLSGCGGEPLDSEPPESLGVASAPLVRALFGDGFEESPATWTTFEEIVGGNPCYGSGIASVAQVTSPRRYGQGSLRVAANAGASTSS